MIRIVSNFIRGMGSILCLMPTRRPSRIGRGIDLNRTDAEALRQDWQRIANGCAEPKRCEDKTAGELDHPTRRSR